MFAGLRPHLSALQLLEKVLSLKVWQGDSRDEYQRVAQDGVRRSEHGVPALSDRTFRAPAIPGKGFLPEGVHQAQFQPMPSGYRKLSAADIEQLGRGRAARGPGCPAQEPGTRPSSAVPYELYAEGAICTGRKHFEITLEARNETFGAASAGAPFHAHTPGKFRDRMELRTRRAVTGHRLTDTWEIAGFEDGSTMRVSGPNGFFREFAGTENDPQIEIRCRYLRTGDADSAHSSRMQAPCNLNVTDLAYKTGNHPIRLEQEPAACSYSVSAVAINGTTLM